MIEIAIIGAGLVGPVLALLLYSQLPPANYKITIYEKRKDPRNAKKNEGRSFDLALSKRALDALGEVDNGQLKELICQGNTVKVHARLIHESDGKTWKWPYGDSKEGQFLHSIERKRLNRLLIEQVRNKGIQISFEHHLTKCDVNSGTLVFEVGSEKQVKEVKADFIFGCDGAFSAVRQVGFMKDRKINMDYEQYYIAHGYRELHVPPNESQEYAFSEEYLHLWPKKDFMLMGLPNPDKSVTLTLFMPFGMFDNIKTEDDAKQFFETHFPDTQQICSHKLMNSFINTETGSMVSIKCHPHFAGKALLIGDSAHAMVPFYGQGVNAGLEDCLKFCECLKKNALNFTAAAEQYASENEDNTNAIVELSLYNFDEMRKFMASKRFIWLHKIENFLHHFVTKNFTPLYKMVAFSRIPYREVVQKYTRQENNIYTFSVYFLLLLIAAIFWFLLGMPLTHVAFAIVMIRAFSFVLYKLELNEFRWKYKNSKEVILQSAACK